MRYNFFQKSPVAPLCEESEQQRNARFKRMQWASFFAVTLGYSMYYVCRTSLNVVKKPIMDAGVLDAKQLGVISSALLFTYAIGKFVNGFLADHSNIRRFMATGLLISTVLSVSSSTASLPTIRTYAASWLPVCSSPPSRTSSSDCSVSSLLPKWQFPKVRYIPSSLSSGESMVGHNLWAHLLAS